MTNAIVTLLFSASYLPGALVLSKTLKQLGLPQDVKLVVLLAATLTEFQYQQLCASFDEIIEIRSINACQDSEELKLLQRPELFQTFSKINVFNLTQFDTVLYLDSDTLPIKPICELFQEFHAITENQIVASPDSGWPDIFNSGVFLIKPSLKIYNDLLFKISNSTNPSFDGADQGLLNEFFQFDSPSNRQWIRLPFLYNVTPSIHYQYQPAYQFFEKHIHVIHFIGSVKPWHEPGLFGTLRDKWWLKYIDFYGHDFNIQKTIDGVEPIYFNPQISPSSSEKYQELHEKPAEIQQKDNTAPVLQQEQVTHDYNNEENAQNGVEILTNPDSYLLFETVQGESQWNPAYEEPPTDGKPEAEHFPKDLNQYKDWQEKAQYSSDIEAKPTESEYSEPSTIVPVNMEPQTSWKAPSIFPWEYENRHVPPTRVFAYVANDPASFDNPWESLPLLKKIRDKKQEEENKRIQEQAARKSSIALDVSETERLKELEIFYDTIQDIEPSNDANSVILPSEFEAQSFEDDEPEKSLSEIVDDLHSLQSSEFEISSPDDGNGDYDVADEGIDSPNMEEPESTISDEQDSSLSQRPGSVDISQLEKDLMDELEV